MIHPIRNLLLCGTAMLLAGCVSSDLPPASQRRVLKHASLQDFAGSYRNSSDGDGGTILWSRLQAGAAGVWRYPDPSDYSKYRSLLGKETRPDSRITLSIQPDGDLLFRNRLGNGTEVSYGRIHAGDYRFERGWIVLKERSTSHGPNPVYPATGVEHQHFAIALNTDRSLLVEQKGRFTGTAFVVLPMLASDHTITVYPRAD